MNLSKIFISHFLSFKLFCTKFYMQNLKTMRKRLNQIYEKTLHDEFNEAEEKQNTKRKTELDVNLIHSGPFLYRK